MGKHPLLNQPAPPIELPATPNGELYKVPIGEKPIALFFFPRAFTVGCVKEACSLRDAQASNLTFKRHPELEVVGVSGDDTTLQASFADKFGLSYPIVSDVGDKLRRAYKVEGFIFGLAPGRETFFIDEKGIVRGVCSKNIDANAHAKFVEKCLLEHEKGKSAAGISAMNGTDTDEVTE